MYIVSKKTGRVCLEGQGGLHEGKGTQSEECCDAHALGHNNCNSLNLRHKI